MERNGTRGNTRTLVPVPPERTTSFFNLLTGGQADIPNRNDDSRHRPGVLRMPIFRGRCRDDGSEVYFWASTGGHTVESAQLVFYSEQPDDRGERQLARALAYITGRPILGVSTRRRNRRDSPYPRVHRNEPAVAIPEIEVIDLTEDTPGSEERNQNTSEGLRNEGGH